MAKELPYFQFEPAEYLTKDISFCSLSAQGLFINVCSYYWQRECDLTKNQLLRRLNYENELNELITEGVIDLEGDKISIKFLDYQYSKATDKSEINSKNGSKGGRPKKPIESEIKPKLNPIESESKGIREEKRKEEEIKEDKKDYFDYWVGYRKQIKKPIKGSTTINALIKRFNETDLRTVKIVVDNSIENNYVGLFWDKVKPIEKKFNPMQNIAF